MVVNNEPEAIMEKNYQRAVANSAIAVGEYTAKHYVKKMPRPTDLDVLNVEDLKKLYFPLAANQDKLLNNLSSNNDRPAEEEESVMFCCSPGRFRRTRRRLTLCAAAVGFFLAGVTLVLVIRHFCSEVQQQQQQPKSSSKAIGLAGSKFRNNNSSTSADDYKLDAVLKDLFVSVKTAKKFHHPRLVILLETWVNLVKAQTWFFTDEEDVDMATRLQSGHLVVTNCSTSHSRTALACKMASEFDHFLQSYKSWWCHFDDDNYVHVTRLAQLLKSHDALRPVYLGKPSTAKPLEIFDLKAPHNVSHFWFATGGAGFCISRTLALKMAPFAADGKFVETGDKFWFPDDVTLGYIVEHLLGEHLTVVPEFHSHLEPMKRINADNIHEQISFSYISYNGVDNVLDLPGPLPSDADPTRFYSLHCRLYSASYCPDDDDADD